MAKIIPFFKEKPQEELFKANRIQFPAQRLFIFEDWYKLKNE
jgi:hypothetical protein